MEQLARAYIKYVVQFKAGYGSSLLYSTSFHPQTERTNQILVDMLHAIAMKWQGSWDEHLEFVEFSYNNSYQTTIQMAPFEALYERRCRSPVY